MQVVQLCRLDVTVARRCHMSQRHLLQHCTFPGLLYTCTCTVETLTHPPVQMPNLFKMHLGTYTRCCKPQGLGNKNWPCARAWRLHGAS